MDTNFLSGALDAACQQAASKTVFVAIAAVVILTMAWIAASLAAASAGKTRATL